jgi:esterase/lipase superfamily enzyme
MRRTWISIAVAIAVLAALALAITQWISGPKPLPGGSWPAPVDAVAVASTRGHFSDGELATGHTAYDYEFDGGIEGWDPDDFEPYDIIIIVHGFNNTADKAAYKFDLARESLQRNGYNGELVGFSWDADTQSDPVAATGFHAADRNAVANGKKLAQFVSDCRTHCPASRLHLIGYSLGARVVLECLQALETDDRFQRTKVLISSVHLLGAAIENEDVERDERYGQAIQSQTQRLVNYYSPEDNTLGYFYPLKGADRALGVTDIEHPENKPVNYESVDATAELLSYDDAGNPEPDDIGDNHSGYLGNRSADGRLLDDGVLDLIVRDILKREE